MIGGHCIVLRSDLTSHEMRVTVGESKRTAVRSENPEADRWCVHARAPAGLSHAGCEQSDCDH